LPHSDPRRFFYNSSEGYTKKVETLDKPIDGICVFEENISPMWEDPINGNGCDLSVKEKFSFTDLPDIWSRLVFGVIGETFPRASDIVGCRIVDKHFD
jgi:hypothetical protein